MIKKVEREGVTGVERDGFRERVMGSELHGLTAGHFWQIFLANNADLITAGGVYRYPVGLGRTHHTTTADHKPRTLTTSVSDMGDTLRRAGNAYEAGWITSISLAFELAKEKFGLLRPTVASLVGIDVEAPANAALGEKLVNFCRAKREPFVLFQAAERSYFLVLMGAIYRHDGHLSRAYLDFTAGVDGPVSQLGIFPDWYYGRRMGDIDSLDLQGGLARRVLEVGTHWGDEGHKPTFDYRHFAHALGTNSRRRANPNDSRTGCEAQICMRVGPKTGGDEFRVVAASHTVPFRFEESLTRGSILVIPEIRYNCGLA